MTEETKTKRSGPPPVTSGPKVVKASSLIPDLSIPHGGHVLEDAYWLGALPTLPMNAAHVCGVTFAHVMETAGTDALGRFVTTPHLGVIRRFLQETLERIVDALPRLIVRFHNENPPGVEHPAAEDITEGSDYADPVSDGLLRRGYIIRLPSSDEEKRLREAGRFSPFIPSANDEPLAAHIYMVKSSQRGENFPPSLAETGLEF